MRHSRTKILILAALFIIGATIGCWAEFRSPVKDAVGMLALPGVFLSLFFFIGPHGSARLFLWSVPICNGVAYAGPVALAFWLRSKFKLRHYP
jgi:hypothetical protein